MGHNTEINRDKSESESVPRIWVRRISPALAYVLVVFYIAMRRDLTDLPPVLAKALKSDTFEFFIFLYPTFILCAFMAFAGYKITESFQSTKEYCRYSEGLEHIKDFDRRYLVGAVVILVLFECVVFLL